MVFEPFALWKWLSIIHSGNYPSQLLPTDSASEAYFHLCDTDGFRLLGISREEFECCMASYFCELAVRNCSDAKWEVREFDFEPGKFEIGIQRGLLHLMLRRFTDHHQQPNNKRRQKIFRMYEERFAA